VSVSGSGSTGIRVVVADDHEIVRVGYAGLLATQPDFTVVGTARDGAEAVRVCREQGPDVVLMDVRMPVMDGIQATARLHKDPDAPRVLVLTTFDLDEHVYDALRAGASGFLLKDTSPEDLHRAVQVVAEGGSLISPQVTRRLVAEHPDLDAVFASCDLTAAGALRALASMGRRVPDDVAVVSFDDGVIAAALGLTAVRQTVEENAAVATRMVLARESRRLMVPISLTVRQSGG